ncbi:VOC family protein [Terriglobus roseus]|uniref:Catechol 2,3-dioxygenase n=1 Tax=Terriglobus roseus TaxID=392734 RepID=A0A1H4MCX9_9BACT|nr:VOC family protein [Terriglobus roseus]SEB80385.1 Catechol 2,3-dioxygenase [Terriglobus roseus]
MKRPAFLVLKTILFCCALPLTAQVTRPAITGVAFARFYTAEAGASQHVYGSVLGLSQLKAGKATIYPVNSLQWIETVPLPEGMKSRMEAVGFTTRDVAALQRFVKSKGVVVEEPLRNGIFAVRDPEGNQVWFVQAGANKRVANTKPAPRAVSQRLIHVGYVVKDEARETAFYQDLLGFRPYWHGGRNNVRSWVSLQVPDGTDWVEFMLNIPADASLKSIGVNDHVSLGTKDMAQVEAALRANGCSDAECGKSQVGLDGKVQMNLYDPDLSRVEMMEFEPRETPCCSPILGKSPTAVESR